MFTSILLALLASTDEPQIVELNPCIMIEAGAQIEGLPSHTPLVEADRRSNGDLWLCVGLAGDVPSFAGPVSYVDAGGVETDLVLAHVNRDGWDDLGTFLAGQPGAEATAEWLGIGEVNPAPDPEATSTVQGTDELAPTEPSPGPWTVACVLLVTAAVVTVTLHRRRGSIERM